VYRTAHKFVMCRTSCKPLIYCATISGQDHHPADHSSRIDPRAKGGNCLLPPPPQCAYKYIDFVLACIYTNECMSIHPCHYVHAYISFLNNIYHFAQICLAQYSTYLSFHLRYLDNILFETHLLFYPLLVKGRKKDTPSHSSLTVVIPEYTLSIQFPLSFLRSI
jgi:hypothetical protein